MHQRHKLRLDVVLAGVALLVLFSVLPFFFQRIDDFEPDSQSRDLADSLDLTNADASTRGERSLTTSSSSSTPNDEDNEEGLEPLTFAELDDQPAQQLKTHHKRPVIEKEKEEERSPAAPKKQQQKPKKMSNVVVEKASDFEATLDRHFADHADDTVLVYLYGNVQPQTGKSWCPDCAAADAPIRNAATAAGMTLIEVPVGERNEYKGQPNNPYRIHPQIKLVSVPTIIKWTKAGPGDRLVENQCRLQAAVEKFLAQ